MSENRLREPCALGELLATEGVPRLQGPVLVSRAGSPLEELLGATVYPLGAMTALAAPARRRLRDEVLRFCVGRTSPNDIVIDELSVSKEHAAIVRCHGDRWVIVDEGSRNGTHRDGERLRRGEPATLGSLATLRFGPRARLFFMHPPVFFDYLDSLRAERASRRVLPLGEAARDRDRFDRTHATEGGGTFEPMAARIIARVRSAPSAGHHYVVVTDGGLPLALRTLSEVISFVEKNGSQILRVEAAPEVGTPEVLYARGDGA
jgi:hypothetical protein